MANEGTSLNQFGSGKRFSFSFSREPIARFISGYNEIEYRVQVKSNRSYPFPMTAPLGTPRRFMQFIEALLRSDGRFLEQQNIELAHVAPQIGKVC